MKYACNCSQFFDTPPSMLAFLLLLSLDQFQQSMTPLPLQITDVFLALEVPPTRQWTFLQGSLPEAAAAFRVSRRMMIVVVCRIESLGEKFIY